MASAAQVPELQMLDELAAGLEKRPAVDPEAQQRVQRTGGPVHSIDNPSELPADQIEQMLGVTEAEKTKIVETITSYRGQWAPDRILRFANWQKNGMFYKGQQILAWDPETQTYFDAVAWFRQQGKAAAGQEIGAEKYQNNITQMLGTGFVGTMSRGIPPTVIRPANAQVLADVTTAKAAQDAITIIERENH